MTCKIFIFVQIGEKIGNPQTLNDVGEVSEEPPASSKQTPLAPNNSYNMGSKPAQANKNSGYGQPSAKSDIITHPIVSLTPYQNKYGL